MKSHITFHYNDLGRGKIVIYNKGNISKYPARTGSIHDELINAIPRGVWYLLESSVDTDEKGMTRTKGKGWKVRLYDNLKGYTHYLIHPDGNKPGSLGCIVVPNDGEELRERIDKILAEQKEIPVYVNVRAVCQ